MQTQAEAGHGRLITMTFAAVPARRPRRRWLQSVPKITAASRPAQRARCAEGQGVTIGMAMTENRAVPMCAPTPRALSAGRSDGPGGLRAGRPQVLRVRADVRRLPGAGAGAGRPELFPVPRWRPDGTKNPLQVLRLKRKMGNVSNASSETELRGALGQLMAGRARRAHHHRDGGDDALRDCMIGSSAGMRMRRWRWRCTTATCVPPSASCWTSNR